MIRSITLSRPGWSSPVLNLPVGYSDTSLYSIINISGITPPEADISTAAYSSRTGAFYTGSHVNKRTIEIDIRMNNIANAYDSIATLYKIISVGDSIDVSISEDYFGNLYVNGYVSRFERDVFSEDVVFTLSIVCPESTFRSKDKTTFTLPNINGDPNVLTPKVYAPTPFTISITAGATGTGKSTIYFTTSYKDGSDVTTQVAVSDVKQGDRFDFSTETPLAKVYMIKGGSADLLQSVSGNMLTQTINPMGPQCRVWVTGTGMPSISNAKIMYYPRFYGI